MAIYEQGDLPRARQLLEEVHRTGQRALGRGHPVMLAVALGLGRVLHADGERPRGIKLVEGALRSARTTFGPDHEATLSLEAGLGKLFASQGDTEKAVPLFEHVVATSQDADFRSKVAEELARIAPAR